MAFRTLKSTASRLEFAAFWPLLAVQNKDPAVFGIAGSASAGFFPLAEIFPADKTNNSFQSNVAPSRGFHGAIIWTIKLLRGG
jgi:hypothetical protein